MALLTAKANLPRPQKAALVLGDPTPRVRHRRATAVPEGVKGAAPAAEAVGTADPAAVAVQAVAARLVVAAAVDHYSAAAVTPEVDLAQIMEAPVAQAARAHPTTRACLPPLPGLAGPVPLALMAPTETAAAVAAVASQLAHPVVAVVAVEAAESKG